MGLSVRFNPHSELTVSLKNTKILSLGYIYNYLKLYMLLRYVYIQSSAQGSCFLRPTIAV